MPFNLQVQPTGGQSMGRGLGKFLGNVLGFVADKQVETKALNEKAGALDKLVKADPEILGSMQIDEEEWKSMGAAEKAQTFEAYTLARGEEKARTNQRYMQGQIQALASKRNQESQEARAMQAINAITQQRQVNVPPAGVMGLGGQSFQVPGVQPNSADMQRSIQTILAQNPQAIGKIQEALALREQAGPRAVPGTVRSVDGLENYVFATQSPSGAGSFLPKPGAAESAPQVRTPSLTERLKLQSAIAEKQAEFNALVDSDPDEITPGLHREMKRLSQEIRELESLRGGNTEAGSAKEAIQSTTPPTVGSREEYNNLPPGTEFTGPDGKRYRKPHA